MDVFWTHNACEQLDAIYQYIAKDSPIYAQRMVDRITGRSTQISLMPLSGRRIAEHPDDQIREIIENPFRIIYRVNFDRIDVLAVIHLARNTF